jgi:eukaryotic-like serine/threonine-protein kinase
LKGTLAVAFIAILCVSMFSAFALEALAQQSSANWPMFHHNLTHSGSGTGNPVLTPTLLWNFNTGGEVGSPAVVNGAVYVSGDGDVYALNTANGAQIWNYTTNGSASTPDVVNDVVYVGSGGELSSMFFGSNDYNVYALNAANGDKIWNYTTGGYVMSSPSGCRRSSLCWLF